MHQFEGSCKEPHNRVYAEYFTDNQPCRTTVEVSTLPTRIAIELKCIATIDKVSEQERRSCPG
jgi:enamine deaminase RidA (YjgF/YER057c/UK114 family)